jgi:hypothetical protein
VRLQDPEQPFSFLSSALRELESPVHEDVLNLASTLGTHRDAREQSPDREQVRAEKCRVDWIDHGSTCACWSANETRRSTATACDE